MPSPKKVELSVIISTHNRAVTLAKTLKTFLEQEGIPGDLLWELLIVNNASDDHTDSVIEKFAEESPIEVQHLSESSRGKSYALNTAVEASRGEVLAFTDDDIKPESNWISSIVKAARTYSHLGFGGRVLPIWPDRIPPWIQPSGPYAKPIVGGPITVHDRGSEIREYGRGMWAPVGGNMFFRKIAFERYGGFDTALGPSGDRFGVAEDCEFGFRLMAQGERILYYPAATVYHPVLPSKLSKDYLLRYAWDSGTQTAAHELSFGISPLRRMKTIVKCCFLASGKAMDLCKPGRNPARRMQCSFLLRYYLGRVNRYARGS